MSKLEQLIEELCPDGVEYKKLEQCCNILDRQRKPVTKSARESGDYPYYGANGIQDYVSDYIFDGTFVLVGEDGSVMTKNGNPVVTWAQGKIWVNNHAHIIEEIEGVLLRYLYHYIQTVDVTPLIHGNIPKLTGGDFKAILIPLPHIEIQREIVRILDNFTELTAELTAELTDRKKQYEYYMESLLNSSRDITMELIGDIFSTVTDYVAAGSFASIAENVSYKNDPDYAQLVRTMDIKSAFTKGNNVYVDKTAFDFLWRVNLDEESIIMPNIGVNCGEVYYVEPENLPYENNVLGPNAILLRSDRYNNKYLYYLLNTHAFQKTLKVIISPGGQTKFNKTGLKNLKLPIPYADDLDKSLAEQQRVVELLDRFDTLCNDIVEGLPAEIAERQKQYEYYRDKLLTFKNIDGEV